ncbi:MAG TPA: class I SAM-dependent methyltransferase [Blastocatellia bacterium]|jgi:SAM-dependent methyltransferase
MSEREKWDGRYSAHNLARSCAASEFLSSNANLLPPGGLALDLASGEGRNSFYLAELGFHVIALDISIRALEKCLKVARARKLKLDAVVADLSRFVMPENIFDVVVVFNYLQRSLAPSIIRCLRPGGVLIYETFTKDHLRCNPGFNPEFVLGRGELAGLFPSLRLMKYREATLTSGGSSRAVASLMAKKSD